MFTTIGYIVTTGLLSFIGEGDFIFAVAVVPTFLVLGARAIPMAAPPGRS